MKKLYTTTTYFAEWLGTSNEKIRFYCQEMGLPHIRRFHSRSVADYYLIPVDAGRAWAEKHKLTGIKPTLKSKLKKESPKCTKLK